MSRIRTIKPEFFTSEDIVSLSPLARLLYISIWCEADKEGRLLWKPRTLKMRYLPADDCDIEALCSEIVAAGLVVLYGDGLAYVPRFKTHQHINPREKDSSLPPPHPDASPRVTDASPRDSDGENTRREEGKGKEGKGREVALSARDAPRPALSTGFGFPTSGSVSYSQWADLIRANAQGSDVDLIAGEFRKFCRERSIPFDHPSIGKTLATFCKKQRAAA